MPFYIKESALGLFTLTKYRRWDLPYRDRHIFFRLYTQFSAPARAPWQESGSGAEKNSCYGDGVILAERTRKGCTQLA